MSDAALGIVLLLVLWSFYRAQRDPGNSVNFFDLIMENGRISRIGFAFIVALLVTSWVMIRIAREPSNPNLVAIFTGYGAMWVIPIVAKLFSPPQTTTTTQTSSSTVTTTPVKVPEMRQGEVG